MQLPFPLLFHRLAVSVVIVLAVSTAVFAKGSFTVKPAPSWVVKVSPSNNDTNKKENTSSTQVLDDQQIKVSGSSVERYYHVVVRVNNASGLDDLSQLQFFFEPSYQQLSIHYVRIERGGTTINALRPSEVKIIQKEEELDQQLYNGNLAALIFLNDLRVGDVVEYAYTVTGDNPVLGGRFVDQLYLADDDPKQEIFLRLLYPTKRPLAIRNDNSDLQPTKQTVGDDIEYIWSLKNTAAITADDAAPDWYNPYPRVNLSEFQSWTDVVNWALPFYQNSSPKSPELLAKVEEWKKVSTDPGERAIAALRFIQDEIRYLGIELGRYSHQPTAPEQVFKRRFGDCKDKSLLLSSVLTAMGIEAHPELVNSYTRSSIDNSQPSPFEFDHVIVKAVINGKDYWFDPTVSYQRGGLDTYYYPPFERGLVLQSGTTALEKIPVLGNNVGSIDVLETYEGASITSPVVLNVTTTYRGAQADEMRFQLSTKSLAELSKTYVNFYADTTPSITVDGLPTVEDNQKANTLVIREKYNITELWKQNRHRFYAERISTELQKPRFSQRSSPLEVHYPLSIKQTIIINLGNSAFDFPVADDTLNDDAFRFEYHYTKSGTQMRMDFALQTFADSVPVNKLTQHLSLLDRAQEFVSFDLSKGPTLARGVVSERPPPFPFWALIIFLVPLALLVFFLIRRRRTAAHGPRESVREGKPRPGASPESAFRVSTEEQMDSLLTKFNCRCGARAYDPHSPAKRERFTYDGQRLFGVRLQCPACKQLNDIYVNVLRDNEPNALTNPSTS